MLVVVLVCLLCYFGVVLLFAVVGLAAAGCSVFSYIWFVGRLVWLG